MDKQLRGLLIKLSVKYDISIVNIQSYNAEDRKFNNKFTAVIKPKGKKKAIKNIRVFSKMKLIMELMEYLKGDSNADTEHID